MSKVKLHNITESDLESLIKIVSQLPVGSKFEDDFVVLERDDPFTFIINVKSDNSNDDSSESIESILFG